MTPEGKVVQSATEAASDSSAANDSNKTARGTPPRHILLRSKEEGADVVEYPFREGEGGSAAIPDFRSDLVELSVDGTLFAAIDHETAAVVYDTSTVKEIARVGKGVSHVSLAPQGTYLLTWTRAPEGHANNTQLWRCADGELVHGFVQKEYSARRWPSLRWTEDESLAARAVSNEVHFFDAINLKAPKFKVRVANVDTFALSPGKEPHYLATFSPTKGSTPSRTQLLSIPDGAVLASQTLFRADSALFYFSPNGKAVLASVHSEQDASDRSYYGESVLFFMDIHDRYSQRVPLQKNGPVYDVQWAPRGEPQFVVVYGLQPACATLFNQKCVPTFNFGSGAWNSVFFSPHARFLALCGFQSLSGDVAVWDRNKESLVGSTKMPQSTSFSWSPCSRFILSATTFPRLRVDNGYKMFKYDGTLLETREYKSHLLQAVFLPAPTTAYPNLPASPRAGAVQEPANGSAKKTVDFTEVKRVYRPPGARDTNFSVMKAEPKVKAGKVNAEELGIEVPSKSKIKATRKKEREERLRREREAEEEQRRVEAERAEAERARLKELPAEKLPDDALFKRLRAARKKQRAAMQLKEQADGGKALNDEQRAKVDDLTKLVEEVLELEATTQQRSGGEGPAS